MCRLRRRARLAAPQDGGAHPGVRAECLDATGGHALLGAEDARRHGLPRLLPRQLRQAHSPARVWQLGARGARGALRRLARRRAGPTSSPPSARSRAWARPPSPRAQRQWRTRRASRTSLPTTRHAAASASCRPWARRRARTCRPRCTAWSRRWPTCRRPCSSSPSGLPRRWAARRRRAHARWRQLGRPMPLELGPLRRQPRRAHDARARPGHCEPGPRRRRLLLARDARLRPHLQPGRRPRARAHSRRALRPAREGRGDGLAARRQRRRRRLGRHLARCATQHACLLPGDGAAEALWATALALRRGAPSAIDDYADAVRAVDATGKADRVRHEAFAALEAQPLAKEGAAHCV